jgi:hypothetical protein
MAEIIPTLNKQTLARMTSGEKRVARRLQSLLEDDYLVWYDIPVGNKRRYPDFIILHPSRGLLFLEVKDWNPETIRKVSKKEIILQTNNGLVTTAHPLEQARQYTYVVINRLSKDPQLCHLAGTYQGRLKIPYGWGTVFTNITRKQIEKGVSEEIRASVLPDHLIIYKDEISETIEAETFQEHLWGMFHYNFGGTLSLPEIDRIRGHLFPEILIDGLPQNDLFEDNDVIKNALPDMIKIMDIQQEQLARSLGEGHRIIHGVAGSGKTMILGFRCLYLAEALSKPILVLCFNITLAAKLRSFISARGIEGQVQIYHFHDWCGQQLKTYHVQVKDSDKPYYDRQVDSVISAVDQGHIPRGQYGALLIDEGHDFDADWLKLVVQMVDPEINSLLLLYDDAQSIYKDRTGLGFSLSSVGIQAQGRTSILKLNYRNTREILYFAYEFARQYLTSISADDDHIPLIEPEAAGNTGPKPVVKQVDSFIDEINYACQCLIKWHKQGVPWNDIAILYSNRRQGRDTELILNKENIPHTFLNSSKNKKQYQADNEQVAVMTIHSSKGQEFPRVIILGIGHLGTKKERLQQDARLLYVGMTRAQECLLLTASSDNGFSQLLEDVSSNTLVQKENSPSGII